MALFIEMYFLYNIKTILMIEKNNKWRESQTFLTGFFFLMYCSQYNIS